MHRRGQRDGGEGGAGGGEGGGGGGGAQHQVQLLPLTRRGGTAHAGQGYPPVPSERKKRKNEFFMFYQMLNINLAETYRYRTDKDKDTVSPRGKLVPITDIVAEKWLYGTNNSTSHAWKNQHGPEKTPDM